MKKILAGLKAKKYDRIIGIDSSTQGIAIAVVDGGRLTEVMYLPLPKADIFARLQKARKWISGILRGWNPDFVMIEAPIYIQNPNTTKNLSYVVGIIVGECLVQNIEVSDVPPSVWKSWIGYKRITKVQQADIMSRLGPTEGRKEIQRLRKSQIQDIMRCRFPRTKWDNDNIADATAIALFAYDKLGAGNG